MMNNKKKYYKVVIFLEKEGLAKEICVCDEKVSILNLADKWYFVCLLSKRPFLKRFVGGFIADSEMIAYISNGYEYYKKFVVTHKDNIECILMNKKFIDNLRRIKLETMEKGPSEFIDYQLEEKLAK